MYRRWHCSIWNWSPNQPEDSSRIQNLRLQQLFVVSCPVDYPMDKHLGALNHIKEEAILDHKISVSHLGYSMIRRDLSGMRMLLKATKAPLYGVCELLCG